MLVLDDVHTYYGKSHILHGVSLEGHGLGLWNVYYLLRMAGGDIDIKSKPGSGTAVTITLPTAA